MSHDEAYYCCFNPIAQYLLRKRRSRRLLSKYGIC